jgi:hypothetical protein
LARKMVTQIPNMWPSSTKPGLGLKF